MRSFILAFASVALGQTTTEKIIVGPLQISFPYWPGQIGLAQGASIRVTGTKYTLASSATLRQSATLNNPAGKRLNVFSAKDRACEAANSTNALSPHDNVLEYTTTQTTFQLGSSTARQYPTGDSTGTPSVCIRIQCMEVAGDCGTQVTLSNYVGYLITSSPAVPAASASTSASSSSTTVSYAVSFVVLVLILVGVALCIRRWRQQQLLQQQQQYPVAAMAAGPVSSYPPMYPPTAPYPGQPPMYPGAAGYAAQPPMYPGVGQAYPPKVVYQQGGMYPQQYGAQQYPQQGYGQQGGMSTGAAVGMGVLGGLVVGQMLDNHHHHGGE